MKVTYDRWTDTLSVILNEAARVVETEEDETTVILDYDGEGTLVSFEIPQDQRRLRREPDHFSCVGLAGGMTRVSCERAQRAGWSAQKCEARSDWRSLSLRPSGTSCKA